MASVKLVLAALIAKELTSAQADGLAAFADQANLEETASRIAAKLTSDRDEYRSGRRGFDRLRDKLWSLMQWRPQKGRRIDDPKC